MNLTKEQIIELYQDGIGISEIGRRAGLATSSIGSKLREWGIMVKDISLATPQELEIIDLFETQHLAIKQICDLMGLTIAKVTLCLKRYGKWKNANEKAHDITTAEQWELDILDMFQNQGMKLKQIGDKMGFTIDKVRECLKRYDKWVKAKQAKCENLPEEEIIELYQQGIQAAEIGKRYNVSAYPIVSILNKTKTRKPSWAKEIPHELYVKLNDKEFVDTLLSDEVSLRNIKSKLKIGNSLVRNTLTRHGHEILKSGYIKSKLNQRERGIIPFTKEEIIKQHYEFNKPMGEIAKMIGVTPGTLKGFCLENNIESQGKSIRLSLEFKELKENPDELRELVKTKSIAELCETYRVGHDTLRKFCKENNITIPIRYRSRGETEVADFCVEILPEEDIIICSKKIIAPYELDIYIPGKKLAIEYCGLYWHSEANGKDSKYHVNKQNMCEARGITLLTIFEDEWQNSSHLIKNRIKILTNTMNDVVKIDARKCVVKEIDSYIKALFLNQFHLQGKDIASVNLGLFFENNLVAVMTFAKPSIVRASNTMVNTEGLWELNRFATNYNYSIRGAAGKLLSYFKNNYQWNEIYSYADRRYSTGNLYKTLGFQLTSISRPNYWYVMPGCKTREYRFKYTKGALVKQGFNKYDTEKTIMEERGFTRIWDCGHYKFVINN